jgi:iron complex outermembrane receptor protein
MYSIQNIPAGNFLIQVRYLGYATITQRIAINGSMSLDFKLSTSVIEQGEVIVTGVSTATEARHTPHSNFCCIAARAGTECFFKYY